MGEIVVPKRSEMSDNPIECITDILESINDSLDETVSGYNGRDASQSEGNPKFVV